CFLALIPVGGRSLGSKFLRRLEYAPFCQVRAIVRSMLRYTPRGHHPGDYTACNLGQSLHASCVVNPSLDAAWQQVKKQARRVKQDTSNGLHLWETGYGAFWIPSESGTDGLFYMLGEQAFDIYATGRMIRPGDIVLDCGANYGAYTRKVLDRGAAKVVAIE